MKSFKRYLPFLIIIVVSFLVFFNSFSNGFVWDDEEQIINNSVIHSLSNSKIIFSGGAFNSGGTGKLLGSYYKPLMTFTFALLYSLFKLNPFYYHLLSIVIYTVNVCLVYILLSKFFDREKSLLLSLLFLVHPLYSEVALYMANMQDLLYFFFGMLGLLFLNPWSIFFFLFSLLSKETGIVFIVVSVIYTFLFERKKTVKVIIYSAIAILVYSLMRFYIAEIYFSTNDMAPIARLDLIGRLKNVPAMLWYYLSNYFWPANISINQHWVIK